MFNFREILAVHMTSLALKEKLQNQSVQILSDNVTTVLYLECMGGPSKQNSDIATEIWALAVKNNITLRAKFIPGVLNTTAESLSRLQSHHEWSLRPEIFNLLNRQFGPFTIDRFASALST